MSALLNLKNHQMRPGWTALILMLLFSVSPARGGLAAGKVPATTDLAGSVTDPLGAAVAAAPVTLCALDRQASRMTTTDQHDHFEFHDVIPGKYALRVNVAGFNGRLAAE